MEISIASSNDISELCTLLNSLFNQEAEFVPDRQKQTRGLTAVLNQTSQKLFIRFAKDHNANFETRLFLDKFNFDNESHEEEILYTIFPLNLKNKHV